jgi:hypothetical protein
MKMLSIVMVVGMFATTIFAGTDVYDIKLLCKTTQIKSGTEYFKDVATQNYNGWVAISYNEDGTVADPCDLIVYGVFPEGKATRVTTISFATFNRFGKKLEKVECLGTTDLGQFTITLSGQGAAVVTQMKPDECGVSGECSAIVRANSASGTLTGWTDGIVCDPCSGATWAFLLNNCLDNDLIEDTIDPVNGTWSMRYNKKVTADTAATSFEEAVAPKIPAAYKPAE